MNLFSCAATLSIPRCDVTAGTVHWNAAPWPLLPCGIKSMVSSPCLPRPIAVSFVCVRVRVCVCVRGRLCVDREVLKGNRATLSHIAAYTGDVALLQALETDVFTHALGEFLDRHQPFAALPPPARSVSGYRWCWHCRGTRSSCSVSSIYHGKFDVARGSCLACTSFKCTPSSKSTPPSRPRPHVTRAGNSEWPA